MSLTKRNYMSEIDKILVDVLALNSQDKLQLIDKMLASIQPTNKGVETVWKDEAEERITAYDQGRVSAVDEQNVLKKYSK